MELRNGMTLFPINEIEDPGYIRVLLYANGERTIHAPLTALLKHVYQDIERNKRNQNKNYGLLLQRVNLLEKKLNAVLKENKNDYEKK
ncbi:hypothetical protein [Bartonella sp. F02]|uniref:hypothetical protein n=1 Tax=Bartonella sp. F02 TaxID=2967262 RepID=UPI0022A92008|nr:hypothetical protein [Bartonella sp. F02]MCZ2328881.1 hypothetical protein [Bartonella sp. F02]